MKTFYFLSTLVAALFFASAHADTPHRHDVAAVHGMVLFGSDPLYISHIPMFAAPHDWQAVLEVKLTHATQDPVSLYKAQFRGNKQPLITLKPRPFVLPQLLDGSITSIDATLYSGSFEEGGTPILQHVIVTVQKVLFKKKLSLQAPTLSHLSYFLAASPSTPTFLAHLVHQIAAPASFDHIVQAQWINPLPVSSVQQVWIPISFDAGDTEDERLKDGETYKLENTGSGWQATPALLPEITVEPAFIVKSSFYCTPGPDFFGPCTP